MSIDLGKSGKLVKTMMGRIQRNKFILFAVLGLIFLVIIIIMAFTLGKRSKDNDIYNMIFYIQSYQYSRLSSCPFYLGT